MEGVVVMDIVRFWRAVAAQKAEEITAFFNENAIVKWHNTNEQFTAEEFVKVNCIYPGEWDVEFEKVVEIDGMIITAVRVFDEGKGLSCHATSFFQIVDDLIICVDEYWGDDGEAPEWRLKSGLKGSGISL